MYIEENIVAQKKIYSEEFKRTVFGAYNEKRTTYKAIAEQYGISAATVSKWVKELEHFDRYGNKSDEEIREQLIAEIAERKINIAILELVGYDETPNPMVSLPKINMALEAGYQLEDILRALDINRLVYYGWLEMI